MYDLSIWMLKWTIYNLNLLPKYILQSTMVQNFEVVNILQKGNLTLTIFTLHRLLPTIHSKRSKLIIFSGMCYICPWPKFEWKGIQMQSNFDGIFQWFILFYKIHAIRINKTFIYVPKWHNYKISSKSFANLNYIHKNMIFHSFSHFVFCFLLWQR